MHRFLFVAVALLVGLFTTSQAMAATYTDPAADQCITRAGGDTYCGSDILSASDSVGLDGSVHLAVTVTSDECNKTAGFMAPFNFGLNRPRFEIYTAATTTPSAATFRYDLLTPYLSDNYYISTTTSTSTGATDIPESVTAGVGTITYDVTIPAVTAATIGPFTWLVGSSCSGEFAYNSPDIAPNTGVYTVNASPPPPPPPPDTTAPSTPSSLTVSSIAQTSLNLAWGSSTDNVAVTGYRIYKGGVLLASTTVLSVNVINLTCATAYHFDVTAIDAAGNESSSVSADATTTACPIVSGGGPTNGPDTLNGTAAANTIHGLGGNDTIHGKGGADKLYGDAGADSVFGDAGNDLLGGGTSRDKLSGGDGNDTLRGDDHARGDTINGGPGRDVCYYNAGDTLLGCEVKIRKA
jgi:chitodextrinase